ncbi:MULTISPECIES: NAD(P)/FAD-dependent oxidoreductase [unclassified Yoonia]|uniref:NAD(P)/FAD-dependent oxidoreductase n=1 Tax=unclassified Yoonia TaxID=2629118 RepID=UPI002AFEC578|nr:MULTISPECIES: FAD-dependent oxidoreductase [unclassified Yoonia]
MNQVIIVGAGVTGLACARRLSDAGVPVIVLDKGRGIGGRMATRRTDGPSFDHGAQYVSAKGEGFAKVLADLTGAGHAAAWHNGIVGVPGMSALAKALGAGVPVQQNMQVTALVPQDGGWQVQVGETRLAARQVIVTVPAPQLADLLGADHRLVAQIAHVTYAPNLTLMAAIDGPAPFVTAQDPAADLAWIAQDSSKPARPQGVTAWVAQASAGFSQQHLELDKGAIADLMLPLLLDRLGASADQVRYVSAHRWRYAFVTQALGQRFLRSDDATLYLGGDWCLGARVEDAWTSGRAIADDVLGQSDAQ